MVIALNRHRQWRTSCEEEEVEEGDHGKSMPTNLKALELGRVLEEEIVIDFRAL